MNKSFFISAILVTAGFLNSIVTVAQNCSACGPSGFAYVVSIPIDNSANSNTLTDFQVLVTVDTQTPIGQSKMNAQGDDIRFTSDCTNLLKYWIEGPMNTTNTRIWVKVPTINANSVDTLFMNYGNSLATPMSDPDSTFDLYDDFNDGVFDNTKWEVRGTFSNLTESGGVVTIAGSNNWEYFRSYTQFSSPVVIDHKLQQSTSAGLVLGQSGTDNRFTFRMSGSNLGTTYDPDVSSSNSYWNSGYPGIVAPNTTSDSMSVIAEINTNYITVSSYCNVTQSACNNNVTPLNQYTASSFYVGFSSWSSNTMIDLIRVRKYTDPEPATNVLAEEQNILLTTAVSVNDALCNGDTTGSATVSANGDHTPFTYQWDANANNQTDSTATGLGAGTYLVTVTDTLGCEITDTVVISEPPAITATTDSTDLLCFGDGDGTATVTASGGVGGFTYQWDSNTGNQTDSTATGLSGGLYSVTITDGNGCAHIVSVGVVEPPPLALNMSSNASTQLCDGNATANPTNGSAPFTYQWDANTNNQILQTATALCAGTYWVTVTDDDGCSEVDTVVVNSNVGIADVGIEGEVRVYPNPSKGSFTIEFSANQLQDIEFRILDVIGREVQAWELLNVNGKYRQEITLTGQLPGVYQLWMLTSRGSIVYKIIIE